MTTPEPVDVTAVADFVGASGDEPTLPGILAAASEVIAERLGASGLLRAPVATLNLATLQLAAEIWQRRLSTGGVIAQFGDSGSVVRLARDSYAVAAKPLVGRYAGLGVCG